MNKRLLTVAAIAGTFVIAFFFRIWMLGSIPGMNGDEAWLGLKAIQFVRGEPFSWKTNSGNFTDPFYLLPLAALHAFFDSSYPLLRAVAVISGVLLLPLNFLLCRKVFDIKTAVISTLLLGVLPINVIYSRFGWEPSQSVLASIPVMYCALWFAGTRTRFWQASAATLFCLIAAVLVHPANFFLVCLLLTAGIFRAFSGVRQPLKIPGFLFTVGIGLLILGGAAYIFAPEFTRAGIVARLPQFPWAGDWTWFAGNYLRLFSGINSYRYLAGSCDWRSTLPTGQVVDFHLWDALTLLFFVSSIFILFFLRPRLLPPENTIGDKTHLNHQRDKVLLASIASSALLIFVLNGPSWTSVSYERYALWMVAPGVLLLSRAAAISLELWPHRRKWFLSSGLLLCWLLLLGFYLQYFRFIQQTGGESEMAFRTGSIEPKLAAAQYMLPRVSRDKPTYIIATDWFIIWPLTYPVKSRPNAPDIRFIFGTNIRDLQLAQDLEEAQQDNRVYFVEFSNSTTAENLRKGFASGRSIYIEETFPDYAGRPAVSLFLPRTRYSPQ